MAKQKEHIAVESVVFSMNMINSIKKKTNVKKKLLIIMLIVIIVIVIFLILLPKCSQCDSKTNLILQRDGTYICSSCEKENYSFEYKTETSSTSSYTYTSSYESFTNKYGTSTTICHHSGCQNYIAKSGDTNCCTQHSRKCIECGCYIDEDALYCLGCIEKAYKKNKGYY